MKSTAVLGLILIILGVLALAYQGINYTKRKTILDIGPVHATADKTERIPLPPVVGGAAIAGGVALLLVSKSKSKA